MVAGTNEQSPVLNVRLDFVTRHTAPDLLPDYFFTSTDTTTDAERIHAYNIAMQSIAKQAATPTVETVEVVRSISY